MNQDTPTHATDDDKDQVKLNQQTSGTEPPKMTSPSPSPAVPPVPPPPPPPPSSPPPPPTPSYTPTPPKATPAPPTPFEPPPPKEEPEIGVGKPNIGVELEEKPANPPIAPAKPQPIAPQAPSEAKIEVQTSDIPIKTYDQAKTTDQPTPPLKGPPSGPKPAIPVSPAISSVPIARTSTPLPPIKTGAGSPATMITVLALFALILGAAGGFFGFRTWDQLKTSASTEKSPEATLTATSTAEKPSLDVSRWQTYTSTLYNFTLKYPNGWVASSTEPSAETIVLAANNESLATDPSNFRIEINFQDANGKTLKSWVEANSTATNEKKAPKEITVDSQTAYQQELTNIRPAMATFIERPDKIMIVTYTAPADKMSEGGDWYNNLINSIKLM